MGAAGLGYINFYNKEFVGPISKNLSEERLKKLNLKEGDSVFFICDKIKEAQIYAGLARTKLCDEF